MANTSKEQLVKVIDFWLKSAESGQLFRADRYCGYKSKEVIDIVEPDTQWQVIGYEIVGAKNKR